MRRLYVELKNICKSFDGTKVLDDVSFSIEKGQLASLLGPSGCGKTTLLRIIAGLETADTGDVFIDGERVNDLSPASRGIGFVFQSYALFRHMTVAGNIAFGLETKGEKPAAIKARVAELLEVTGLAGLGERYPAELSGGQRQRVAFARAIAPNPQVLLLDEPFAAIDAKVRREMRAWLKETVRKLGITSIFVTHDQDEALEVSDRIIVMSEGHMEQVGDPTQIYEAPASAFVAQFAGNAPIIEDWGAIHGFTKEDAQSTALVRPEYVEAFRSDNADYAELMDIAQEGVLESIAFRGFYFELGIRVAGQLIYTHRGLNRRRAIEVGEKMLVVVSRLYVMRGNEVSLVENALLEGKSIHLD